MEVKEHYTWEQFDRDCEKIAYWASDKHFTDIYGIPRGGLIVAVKLSHLLNIPVVLNEKKIGAQTLIVDDIIDTGGTVENLFSIWSHRPKVASLYMGGDPKVNPDFFLRTKGQMWVVFPWETDETSKYDGTKGDA